MKTVNFKAFAGVRNDVSLDRFGHADLSAGMNIDLDETGRVARRAGVASVVAGVCHSLWGGDSVAYVVKDGVLNHVAIPATLTAIKPIAGGRVRYTEINNTVYWTDGVESGHITNKVDNSTLGIVPPGILSATIISGTLRPGMYLVSMTYVRASGEESGAPRSTEVAVAENEGIRLYSLPVSTDPTVISKNIYVSAWDGETCYLAATLSNSDVIADIADQPSVGAALRTQFMVNAPAGQVIAYHGGRLYIAEGQYLWYSQPFEYGLFDARFGFIGMKAEIRTIAPNSNGLFVGTSDETYWLAGTDPTQFLSSLVSDYGTVLGTEATVPEFQLGQQPTQGQKVCWYSAHGLCVGYDDGHVVNTTGGRYIHTAGREGASLFKVRGGTPQFLVTLEV